MSAFDSRFDALLARFERMDAMQNMKPLLEEFGKLLIDELQALEERSQMTEASEKYPLRARLYAMDPANQKIRASFMGRLKLKADVVNRWHAKLDLEFQEEELKTTTEALKRLQDDRVFKAFKRCCDLMFDLIKQENPRSIAEFRQLLDATYCFDIQQRAMTAQVKRFQELVPHLFNGETFKRFRQGVILCNLHDKWVASPDAAALKAYEGQREKLAAELRGRLVRHDGETLPEAILEEYPALVNYRVFNEQQCVLRSMIEERIQSGERTTRFVHPDIDVGSHPLTPDERSKLRQLKLFRIKAGELKTEFGLPNEAETKVQLLRALRYKLANLHRNGKRDDEGRLRGVRYSRKWGKARSLLHVHATELPVTIVLTAMKNAAWEDQQGLDAILADLFADLPPRAYVRTLMREMRLILRATPDRYHDDIRVFRDFIRKEYRAYAQSKRSGPHAP